MRLTTAIWLILSTAISGATVQGSEADRSWPTYGGSPGGQRYSGATQITPGNVGRLQVVWQYHTKALEKVRPNRSEAAFEATPVLHGRTLFLSTPFDDVIAVDAVKGTEMWRFDARLSAGISAGVYTSRGVGFWSDSANVPAPCKDRVFIATLDSRLIALDAATGTPCNDFGSAGTIDLRRGVPTQTTHPYEGFGATSPPTVVGDVVVVGSVVADGKQVDVEPGVVRGYDVRSGQLLWTWDPLIWAHQQTVRTGAGNTWSIISADLDRHIIYLPTGSPSPDFYGGLRPGDNKDANSVVALDAISGKRLWGFQVVHHDLWDYDVASEPLLFQFQNRTPAIAITTKMGMVFVLNRVTGAPIFPVEERPVPQSDVPGEVSSPTQPFSSIAPLAALTLRTQDLKGHTYADAQSCIAQLDSLRNEGIFTPPSLRGSLLYPGSLGGVNWGSPAFDPETGTLYVNSNHHAFRTTLVPRWRFQVAEITSSWENWVYASASLLLLLLLLRRSYLPGWSGGTVVLMLAAWGGLVALKKPTEIQHFGTETAPQRGSPFAVERSPIQDKHGLPCTPTPWGKLTALNLNTGMEVWEKPLGTMVRGAETGSLNLGGPIVTAGGLVFVAATREPVLRALDKVSGAAVWTGTLPVPAQSTPMTYMLDGRQFVVVAAGGHGGFGTPQGDSLVAFALPQ